jgi:hypothetical protein
VDVAEDTIGEFPIPGTADSLPSEMTCQATQTAFWCTVSQLGVDLANIGFSDGGKDQEVDKIMKIDPGGASRHLLRAQGARYRGGHTNGFVSRASHGVQASTALEV